MEINKLIGEIYLIKGKKYMKEVDECGNIHFYKLFQKIPEFKRVKYNSEQ